MIHNNVRWNNPDMKLSFHPGVSMCGLYAIVNTFVKNDNTVAFLYQLIWIFKYR